MTTDPHADPRPDPRQTLIEELDKLLETERELLVRGKLQGLEDLLHQKETLIVTLTELDGLEADDLLPLRGKVLRNQALLDGALRGIRAVANRFSTLRRIRKTLETYDEKGQKASLLKERDNKLEKRA